MGVLVMGMGVLVRLDQHGCRLGWTSMAVLVRLDQHGCIG